MRVFHGVSLSLVAHRTEGVTRSRVLRTARLYKCNNNNNNNSINKVIVTIKPSAHDDTCLKYNSFHVLRVKSHSHLLSHFVFHWSDSHKKQKSKIKKKSGLITLSGFYPNFLTIINRTRTRRKTHTQRKARLFLSSPSLSFKTTRL